MSAIRLIVVAAFVLAASPALPHDAWSTGAEVPAWVKADCCGKADAHLIPPEAVHIKQDGYHIDGIKSPIPFSRVLPSQDGRTWVFFSDLGLPDPAIYCAFAPLNGV